MNTAALGLQAPGRGACTKLGLPLAMMATLLVCLGLGLAALAADLRHYSALSSLLQIPTALRYGHLVITPLAPPQLGSCASSGRAWRR